MPTYEIIKSTQSKLEGITFTADISEGIQINLKRENNLHIFNVDNIFYKNGFLTLQNPNNTISIKEIS